MKMLDTTLSDGMEGKDKSSTVINHNTKSDNMCYRRKNYFNNQHSLQSIVQSSTSSSKSIGSPSISIPYGSKEGPSLQLPYENNVDRKTIFGLFDSTKSYTEGENNEKLNFESRKFPRKCFLIDSLLEERQKRLAAAAAMVKSEKENANAANSQLNCDEVNVTEKLNLDLTSMEKNDSDNDECKNDYDTVDKDDMSEPMDLKFKKEDEFLNSSMEERGTETMAPHSPGAISEPEPLTEDPSTSYFPADPSPSSTAPKLARVTSSSPSQTTENTNNKTSDMKKHNENTESSTLINLAYRFVSTMNNNSSDEIKRQSLGQNNSTLMNEYLNRLKILHNTMGLNSFSAAATGEMGSNSAANTSRALHSYNPLILLQMANSTNNGTQNQFFLNNNKNNMATMAKQHAMILQHQATLALRNRLSAAAAIAAAVHNNNNNANSTSTANSGGSNIVANVPDTANHTSKNHRRISHKELDKSTSNDVPYTATSNSKTVVPSTAAFSTVKCKTTTHSVTSVTRPYANSLTLGRAATISGSGRVRNGLPHRSSNAKKYRCDICEKTFSRSNTLITHKRIHTGEKPFRCEHCGRAFRQPGNLTRHAYTHTTVKPFVCAECGKAFNRASNLHTHMRVHTLDQASTPRSGLIQPANVPFSISNQFDANKQLSMLLGSAAIAAVSHSCMNCGKSFEHKLELRTHQCQGRSLLI